MIFCKFHYDSCPEGFLQLLQGQAYVSGKLHLGYRVECLTEEKIKKTTRGGLEDDSIRDNKD